MGTAWRGQDAPSHSAGPYRRAPPQRAYSRADKLFKRLKAARLDSSAEAEMRRLTQLRLLIIDDFALQPLDAPETADFYELTVARHHTASTVLTSNRGPDEWLAMMIDPLLAQSAVDRLISTAHELRLSWLPPVELVRRAGQQDYRGGVLLACRVYPGHMH